MAGEPGTTGRPFLAELTGLRFIAALWVVCYHTMPKASGASALYGLVAVGYTAVTLFFVLSGFVLVYTYGPTQATKVDSRNFYLLRVARLYPMYLVALTFAIPELIRLHYGTNQVNPMGIGRTLVVVTTTPLLLQAWLSFSNACAWNCPGWSLSTETLFYAIFPVVATWLYRRRGGAKWLLGGAFALAFLAAGLRDTAIQHEEWGFLHFLLGSPLFPLLHVPEFLAGALIGRWYLDRRLRGASLRPGPGGVAVILAAVGIVLVSRTVHPVDGPFMIPWMLLFDVLLIVGLAERGGGWLASAPLVLLGEASYSLYLIHGPLHVYILSVAKRLVPGSIGAHPWVVFAAYVAIAVALSISAYSLVERPARAHLRRRFALRPAQ